MHAMNDALARPRAAELDGVLAAGVHTVCGDRAQLTHWEARVLSDRPGRRVVHYRVGVQLAEAAAPQCWQCVGKFYGCHETALKVGAALRMLEASQFTPQRGVPPALLRAVLPCAGEGPLHATKIFVSQEWAR